MCSAYPHVRSFDRSQSVVAGRTLELDCRAWGWRLPNVTWYRGAVQLSNRTDPRVEVSEGAGHAPGSRLTITGITEADRAYYTCVATSDQWDDTIQQYNATVLVRVKGRRTHAVQR